MGDSRNPPNVEETPENGSLTEQEKISGLAALHFITNNNQNDNGPETPVGAANLQVRRPDTFPSIQTLGSAYTNVLNPSMRIGNYKDMSTIVHAISMRAQRLFSSAENIENGFSLLETRISSLMEANHALEEENNALHSQVSDHKADNKVLLVESKTHGRTLELMQCKMESLAKDLRSAEAAQRAAEQSSSLLHEKYLKLKSQSERDLKLATGWLQMREVEHEHAAAEAHGFMVKIQNDVAQLKAEKKFIQESLDSKEKKLESCQDELRTLTKSCKEAWLKYDECESRLESTLKELEDIKKQHEHEKGLKSELELQCNILLEKGQHVAEELLAHEKKHCLQIQQVLDLCKESHEKTLHAKDSEIQSMKHMRDSYAFELTKVKRDCDSARDLSSKQASEITILKSLSEKTRVELDALQAQLKTLEFSNKSMKTENLDLKDECALHRAKLLEVEKALSEALTELAKLKESETGLSEQHAILQETSTRYQKEISDLKDQIATMEVARAAPNMYCTPESKQASDEDPPSPPSQVQNGSKRSHERVSAVNSAVKRRLARRMKSKEDHIQ